MTRFALIFAVAALLGAAAAIGPGAAPPVTTGGPGPQVLRSTRYLVAVGRSGPITPLEAAVSPTSHAAPATPVPPLAGSTLWGAPVAAVRLAITDDAARIAVGSLARWQCQHFREPDVRPG